MHQVRLASQRIQKMKNREYTIEQIADIIEASSTLLAHSKAQIRTLCYDSRKITDPSHALFFALDGQRDGHAYVAAAYQTGVRNFVVQHKVPELDKAGDCNLLYVNHPLSALQQLAGYHRNQFNYPVIAITGSNGKTIVKEWLYQLLSPDYHIVRSPKSYNSQLGVPLSLWQMDEQYNLAIIEAGISKMGEMAALQSMIQPSIGVLTNLGHAHNEGFPSDEAKLLEKLTLFKDAALVVYSPQYTKKNPVPGIDRFTWSLDASTGAMLEIFESIRITPHTTLLKAHYQGNASELTIPFTDGASIENCVCCWAVLLALGYKNEEIAIRLAKLFPINMRLTLKNGINNCSIIDDSYSNDLSSLTIALDFLLQQQQHKERILILSDIPADPNNELDIYHQVAALIKDKQVNKLIGVGKRIKQYANLFQIPTQYYDSTEALLQMLPDKSMHHATLLIKGARTFGFERISKQLTLQTHETTLEINLSAIEHNLNTYKRLLKKEIKLMVMVKAFSYGSGSFEIANLLQFNKVDYLTVAYIDEGITLRNNGIQLPIVVMSPSVETLEQLIQHQLEPEIYSMKELQILIELLQGLQKKHYPIHIKVDTGMHRLGFEPSESTSLLTVLRQTDRVRVASVFSHLAASGDSQHDTFTQKQIRIFDVFTSDLQRELPYTFIRHIANTAAIERFPSAQFDMVRLGIGLYGVPTNSEKHLPLQPVARLKTGITQIKHIEAGETIGYNRKGKLSGGGTIATVKIGYADGYNRRLGNGVGKMMINGQYAPVVGDVCMDMCMLDLTEIDAAEGDEVLVMGPEIPVEQLATTIGTIPYEILTGISQRVRRVYYYE